MPLYEEKIEFIKRNTENCCNSAVSYNKENHEMDIELMKEISQMMLEEIPYNKNIVPKLNNRYVYRMTLYFMELMFTKFEHNEPKRHPAKFWSEKDPFIQGMLENVSMNFETNFPQASTFIGYKLTVENGEQSKSFIQFLLTKNLSIQDIVQFAMNSSSPFEFYDFSKNKVKKVGNTGFYEMVLAILKEEDPNYGKETKIEVASKMHEAVKLRTTGRSFDVLKLLLEYAPEILNNEFDPYLMYRTKSYRRSNLNAIELLLEKYPQKSEKIVLSIIDELRLLRNRSKEVFNIFYLLNKTFPDKYDAQIRDIGEQGLGQYLQSLSGVDSYSQPTYENVMYSNYLLGNDFDSGRLRIMKYVKESKVINVKYLEFLDEKFGKESIPYLKALIRDDLVVQFATLYTLLRKYNVTDCFEEILTLAISPSGKAMRAVTVEYFSHYLTEIRPRAQVLLKGKTINERIVGVMILKQSDDSGIQKELIELLNKERNDDTRDILLDSLHNIKFAKAYMLDQVLEMIDYADKRKKLSKWSEKWIDESSLPKLFWKATGDALSEKQTRFLFYRSKRKKGLNSDIEAKQLINQLDKSKSEKFAIALLQAFQDSNSNTKLKWYMTLAGLIGGDAALTKLNVLFKKSVTDKRWKLAEYLVAAIAMVGSNKAFRIVEQISRKYASKRPRISKSAIDAMEAAAIEINITTGQLADRIIPNFGFEDLYKNFEVVEEPYRAFINKEFKLNYFNQDNKLRKSVPKGASKELVKELKETQKLINEVVKSQKGRLEKYLVDERKWTVEEWNKYYLNNPLMLIYVQKLLWGLYKDEHLIKVFYCDDDIDLYDLKDEEVVLDSKFHIGIVHPIHMEDKFLEEWKNKVYDMDFDFEFEILNRPIEMMDSSEIDKTVTKVLFDKKIPKGADAVAPFLLRRGWLKETGDGGHVYFRKVCSTKNICARPGIEGPMAWYLGGQEKAVLNEIIFSKEGGNWNSIKLSDVPKVFYSEVISDLRALVNAE